jgi:hypothetical protein
LETSLSHRRHWRLARSHPLSRDIGAEVSLFTCADAIPRMTADWFNLLQSNPFVGMSFLAVFDLFNYFLEGLIFLALGVLFWQMNNNRYSSGHCHGFDHLYSC